MLKDCKLFMDGVRSKIPPNTKVVVAYIDQGRIVLSQANCSQADVAMFADTLTQASAIPILG